MTRRYALREVRRYVGADYMERVRARREHGWCAIFVGLTYQGQPAWFEFGRGRTWVAALSAAKAAFARLLDRPDGRLVRPAHRRLVVPASQMPLGPR